MATVSATITLSSAAGDLTTNALSLSDSNAIWCSETSGLARMKVTQTAVNADSLVLYTASDYSAPAYIYIKNTDATATDYIYVYDDTTSGDPVLLKLAGGDWAFMPLNAGLTLKAYATTNPTTVEWMVFGTDA